MRRSGYAFTATGMRLIQVRVRRGEPPQPLRKPSLRLPAKAWGLDLWPPVTPFHRWIGLHARTLQREAAQRERIAAQI